MSKIDLPGRHRLDAITSERWTASDQNRWTPQLQYARAASSESADSRGFHDLEPSHATASRPLVTVPVTVPVTATPPPDAETKPKKATRHQVRAYNARGAGIILTGRFAGQPRRPVTDRKRALDLNQVRDVANAAGYSATKGRPLHALLTVSWKLLGQFTIAEWAGLQTQLFDDLRQFLGRRGIEGACVWVRENVSNIGPHTHAAIYIGPNPVKLRQPIVEYLSEKFGFEPGGWTSASAGSAPTRTRCEPASCDISSRGLTIRSFDTPVSALRLRASATP